MVVKDDNGSDLPRLAYELSLRALAQQEASLNELRAQTGTLLAASSIVASFLGGRAFGVTTHQWIGAIALGAFILSLLACVYVLMPKRALIFSVRASVLMEEEFEQKSADTYRRLAYWLERFFDENTPTVNRLFSWYRRAAVAVLVEVMMWTIQLAAS